jgi:hypothetical protein
MSEMIGCSRKSFHVIDELLLLWKLHVRDGKKLISYMFGSSGKSFMSDTMDLLVKASCQILWTLW